MECMSAWNPGCFYEELIRLLSQQNVAMHTNKHALAGITSQAVYKWIWNSYKLLIVIPLSWIRVDCNTDRPAVCASIHHLSQLPRLKVILLNSPST